MLTKAEVIDQQAKRRWSKSYLNLTHAEPDKNGDSWAGDPDHALVNWVSAQSAPPMLPPLSAGSASSELIELLADGHEGVELSREEMDKLCAWIDLGVPFCGDYTEANTWSSEELAKYELYSTKRQRLAAEEEFPLPTKRTLP